MSYSNSSKNYYIVIAIVGLLFLFIISLVLYFRRPSPELATSDDGTLNINTSTILEKQSWVTPHKLMYWPPHSQLTIDWNENIGPLTLFNLSVVKTSDGFVGLVRGAINNFSYPYYIILDNSANIQQLYRLDFDYNRFTRCKNDDSLMQINGIEDPRYFKFRDEEYGVANTLGYDQQPYFCVNTMAIFKISDPQNSLLLLSPPSTVNPRNIQKNWAPFEYTDVRGRTRLLCEYSINPHIILQINLNTGQCTEIANTILTNTHYTDINKETSLRGGACPVLIQLNEQSREQVYLNIGHTRTINHDYQHFFYIFEAQAPFKILAISDTFKFNTDKQGRKPNNSRPERIQFATGLSVGLNRNGQNVVYVSYGVQDKSNRITNFTFDRLKTLLKL